MKGGATEAQLKAGIDIREVVAGVHIRFIPENEKGEEITSRKFKDLVVFTVMGIAERVSAGMTSGGKQKYATNVIDMENWKNTSPNPSKGGESGNTGGGESTGGNGGSQSQGGNQTSGDTTSGYALSISRLGSGSASVTHNGSNVSSGAKLNEDDEVDLRITPAEGQTPTATINGSSIELTEEGGVYTGSFAMPGQASTLVINTGQGSGGDEYDPNGN